MVLGTELRVCAYKIYTQITRVACALFQTFWFFAFFTEKIALQYQFMNIPFLLLYSIKLSCILPHISAKPVARSLARWCCSAWILHSIQNLGLPPNWEKNTRRHFICFLFERWHSCVSYHPMSLNSCFLPSVSFLLLMLEVQVYCQVIHHWKHRQEDILHTE